MGETLQEILNINHINLENVDAIIFSLVEILKNCELKNIIYFVSNEISKSEEHPFYNLFSRRYKFLFSVATNILPEAFLLSNLEKNPVIYFCDTNPYQLVIKLLTLLLIYKNKNFNDFDREFKKCMDEVFNTKMGKELEILASKELFELNMKFYNYLSNYLRERYKTVREILTTATVNLISGDAVVLFPTEVTNEGENWLVYFSNIFDYVKEIDGMEISEDGLINVNNIIRWVNKYAAYATYLFLSIGESTISIFPHYLREYPPSSLGLSFRLFLWDMEELVKVKQKLRKFAL